MDYLDETENTPGFKLFFALAGGLFVLFLGLSVTLLTTTDHQPQTLQSYTLMDNSPTRAGF
ncbi:MAG: hypothetical protein MK008_12660 [Bdellovibrionales bacterium]|nr:hypothetical protein [Bdellovibrionales bacterium]